MRTILVVIALLIFNVSAFAVSFQTLTPTNPLHLTTVRAEDEDEDEHEDEDEEDEDEHEDEEETSVQETKSTPKASKKTETVRTVQEVIEYKPVQKTVTVTEDAYTKDTDGDSLVDAIDPDPLVDQRQYFTDDDNDAVPNALDQYPGEDDFSYYDFETDDNNNGIIDSYENS